MEKMSYGYNDENSLENNPIRTNISQEFFHDFKNILAIISGLAQISMTSAETDEVKGYLKRINKATFESRDALNKYYNDLSLYSNNRNALRPCCISDVVKEVLEDISFKLNNLSDKKSNIKLDVNIASNEKILCDGYQIYQSILNVVINALDAMEDVSDGILRVNIYNDRSKQNVIIEIIDTGIGISEENMKKIFYNQFTTKINGTGLGLPIAKNSIESLGGNLYITSKKNIGTKVTIKLPIYYELDM